MKKPTLILTVLIFLIMGTVSVYGQRSGKIFSRNIGHLLEIDSLINWGYNDFLQNNIVKVVAFDYPIFVNSKNDSSLLFEKKINLDSNIIEEVMCRVAMRTHGSDFCTYRKIKKVFNKNGKLIKVVNIPSNLDTITIMNGKEWFYTKYLVNIHYDERNRKTKSISKELTCESRYLKGKADDKCDTTTTIYKYQYNRFDKEIRRFYSVTCSDISDCWQQSPYHLRLEKQYDLNGNLKEEKFYDSKSNLTRKTIYHYNDSNKIIKRIDSSGWYPSEYINPPEVGVHTYFYENKQLFIQIAEYTDSRYLYKYDQKGNNIEWYKFENNQVKSKSKTSYEYKGNLLLNVQRTSRNRKTLYKYDTDSFLIEKREYSNDKLTSLIKYYYDKLTTDNLPYQKN